MSALVPMDAEVAAALDRTSLGFRDLTDERLGRLREDQMAAATERASASETTDLTVAGRLFLPGGVRTRQAASARRR